jgi:hypothetical protein
MYSFVLSVILVVGFIVLAYFSSNRKSLPFDCQKGSDTRPCFDIHKLATPDGWSSNETPHMWLYEIVATIAYEHTSRQAVIVLAYWNQY